MSPQSPRNMPDVTREEEESLLFGELKTLETSSSPTSTTISLPKPLRLYILALHTVVLILIIALFAVNTTDNCPNPTKEQSWSPVQQSVDYELQTEYASDQTSSVYAGPPSVEQDRAWDKLIRPTFFRTTKEELERAGESFENIAELPEGGYVATLGVYHELHCVRQVRFYLAKERYYPNLTEGQERYLHHHIDHCLEALRRTVMCRGNTALRSFAWNSTSDRDLPIAQSNSKSTCVRWSSIEDWARSRMVPVHPSLIRPPENEAPTPAPGLFKD